MLFNKILVAYDGSDHARKALDKAIAIIKQQMSNNEAAELEVIHVYHYPTVVGDSYAVDAKKAFLEGAEEILKKAKAQVPQDLKVNYVLQNGDPSQKVLDYSKENSFDLIVTGSRGRGPVRELFLGSVSHNIVQQSQIPVLIVK